MKRLKWIGGAIACTLFVRFVPGGPFWLLCAALLGLAFQLWRKWKDMTRAQRVFYSCLTLAVLGLLLLLVVMP